MNRKEKVTGKRFPVKAAILLMILFIGCAGAGTRSYAASKITLKSGATAPSSVLAGHSHTLMVYGTAVKFYSSNKKVATIGNVYRKI